MRRILVCEDEDFIRDFEVINLQRSGYTVVDVASGEEAGNGSFPAVSAVGTGREMQKSRANECSLARLEKELFFRFRRQGKLRPGRVCRCILR